MNTRLLLLLLVSSTPACRASVGDEGQGEGPAAADTRGSGGEGTAGARSGGADGGAGGQARGQKLAGGSLGGRLAAFDAFIGRFGAIYCARQDGCDRSAGEPSSDEACQRAVSQWFGATRDAIEEGEEFDAAKANGCLARLMSDGGSCTSTAPGALTSDLCAPFLRQ